MKAVVMGLLMLVSSVSLSAWASDEFTAASKSGQAQKVDVYPQASDEVSIAKNPKGGAILTLTSITSWCGMVTLSTDAKSLAAGHALFGELVKERSGIPGEVATQENLILGVIDGELNCRIESVQNFEFDFKGAKLIGKGKPFVSQKTKGQACNDLIARF